MTAGRWEGFWTDALHLVVLANFAVAQPLYAVLGQAPEFFVARETRSLELCLLVVAVGLGLPALAVLVEAVAALAGRRPRMAAHFVLVTACVTAIVLQAARDFDALPADMIIVDAVLVAGVVTGVYAAWRPLRMVVTLLAPAPLVFATLFLGFMPVARVAFPSEEVPRIPVAVGRPHPVVLVVFDEFTSTLLMDQRRRIDPVRYPNLAALTAEATWYRNATTVNDMTLEAVPAILTGRRPGPSKRSPTYQDHPENLFTLLGDTYALSVFESVTRLCPESLCPRSRGRGSLSAVGGLLSDLRPIYLQIVLPVELRRQLSSGAETWGGLAVEAVREPVALFERFVGQIRRTSRPTLYVLHSLLPHQPWRYLPSGKTYDLQAVGFAAGRQGRHGEDRWLPDEWTVIHGLQQYVLQVGMVDRLVGDLVRQLKTAGIYEEAMIILTADHGLSFEAGALRRNVLPDNAADIMSVPLVVKFPGQRVGEVTDRNAETVDILPTIADVLDAEVRWRLDGRSLLGPARADGERKAILAAADRSVLEVDASLDGRWDTLARMLELFGSGATPDGLYRIGPYAGLVGRPLAVVEARAGEPSVKLVLDSPHLWAAVDPDGPFVPARLTGRVVTAEPRVAPLDLAVSVNGSVRAVTRTLPPRGRVAPFAAMLPEHAFRRGENVVEVFLVTGSKERPVLQRLRRETAATGWLSRDPVSGQERILVDGRAIPVVPGAVRGGVDRAEPSAGGLFLAGWAVDPAARASTRGVLVFVGAELVYAGEPDVVREDVSALIGSAAARESGFMVEVPARSSERDPEPELRVFALAVDGRASELAYCVGCRRAPTGQPGRGPREP